MSEQIASVRRAVRVLTSFSADRPALGISDLSRQLDMPKSMVHRLVSTLVAERLLEQDPATAKYRLGPRLYELGAAAPVPRELRAVTASSFRASRTEDWIGPRRRKKLDSIARPHTREASS